MSLALQENQIIENLVSGSIYSGISVGFRLIFTPIAKNISEKMEDEDFRKETSFSQVFWKDAYLFSDKLWPLTVALGGLAGCGYGIIAGKPNWFYLSLPFLLSHGLEIWIKNTFGKRNV